jgi:hypothetical protein
MQGIEDLGVRDVKLRSVCLAKVGRAIRSDMSSARIYIGSLTWRGDADMSPSVAGRRSQNGCDVLVAKGVVARENVEGRGGNAADGMKAIRVETHKNVIADRAFPPTTSAYVNRR